MERSIAIIGLGYVGLPVLIAFSKIGKVCGFDVSKKRISELKEYYDRNNEVAKEELENPNIYITDNIREISQNNFFIVAVPTPVNEKNIPDLAPIKEACKLVAQVVKNGDIIVFESTVYPGTTEEICMKLLEEHSGLTAGKDFKIGYSPERINPGDRIHTFENITKVVSGMDDDSLEKIYRTYKKVIKGDIFKAKTIKTAEAAKIIENTQRDINIALMNELSIIFSKLDINTLDVLEAANTKWNFLDFKPGLVGGHCIGVDPYYLTYKAQQVGYDPEVILSGRNINDRMSEFISKAIIEKVSHIKEPSVTIFGVTFKENCPDTRNSKVFDIISQLKSENIFVQVHDPIVNEDDFLETDILLSSFDEIKKSDALVFPVPHNEFSELSFDLILNKLNEGGCIFDIKGLFRDIDKDIINSVDIWTL